MSLFDSITSLRDEEVMRNGREALLYYLGFIYGARKEMKLEVVEIKTLQKSSRRIRQLCTIIKE